MPDGLTRLINRIGNRRSPDCGTLQPLYVSSVPGSRLGFLRSGRNVVPCPGSGIPLRLLDSTSDPQGIVTAAVFSLGVIAAALSFVIAAASNAWVPSTLVVGLVLIVFLAWAIAFGLSFLRIRGRRIVPANEAPQVPVPVSETPQ